MIKYERIVTVRMSLTCDCGAQAAFQADSKDDCVSAATSSGWRCWSKQARFTRCPKCNYEYENERYLKAKKTVESLSKKVSRGTYDERNLYPDLVWLRQREAALENCKKFL